MVEKELLGIDKIINKIDSLSNVSKENIYRRISKELRKEKNDHKKVLEKNNLQIMEEIKSLFNEYCPSIDFDKIETRGLYISNQIEIKDESPVGGFFATIFSIVGLIVGLLAGPGEWFLVAGLLLGGVFFGFFIGYPFDSMKNKKINNANLVEIISNNYKKITEYYKLKILTIKEMKIKEINRNLTHVVVPDGIEVLTRNFFSDFPNCEYITLPNTIKKIEDGAFPFDKKRGYDKKYKEIVFLGDVNDWIKIIFEENPLYITEKFYVTNASNNKEEIVDINIPGKIKKLNNLTFIGAKSLKKVTISDGVEIIGKSAFEQCWNLEELFLPSTLTTIEENAFLHKHYFKKIYYNGDFSKWEKIKFANEDSIPFTHDFYLLNKSGSFELLKDVVVSKENIINSIKICCSLDTLESMVFLEGIEEIEIKAVTNNLNKIQFPSTLKKLKISSLYCSKISEIYYEGSLEKWLDLCDEKMFKIIKSKTNHIYVLNNNGKYEDVINKIYRIKINSDNYSRYITTELKTRKSGRWSTSSQESIGKLITPSNVEGIINVPCLTEGKSGYKLEEILCNTSLEWIEKEAFKNHEYLKKITIPSTLQRIGESAFYGCRNIEELVYLGTIEDWSNIAFENEHSNPMRMGEKIKFVVKKQEDIPIIGRQKKMINEYQFYNINILTEIKINDSVERLGVSAFEKCENLKDIYLPKSLVNIGANAFKGCKSVKKVYFGGSFQEWQRIIFDNKFSDPSKYAEELFFYNEITDEYYKIEDFQFNNNLTSITAKDTCGLINIKSVRLHKDICLMGEDAFKDCKFLKTVYYDGTINEWQKVTFENDFSNPLKFAEEIFFYDKSIGEYYKVKHFSFDENSIIDSTLTKCIKEIQTLTISSPTVQIIDKPFIHCPKISNLELPCSIDINNIGLDKHILKEINYNSGSKIEYVLHDCENVSKITLPNTLKSIAKNAFEWCCNLKEVFFKGTLNEWCEIEFESRKSNPMFFAKKLFLLNEQNEWYLLTDLVIPNEIIKIGQYQFYGFKQLESLKIDNNIEFIGNEAFKDCCNIKTLSISNIEKTIKKTQKNFKTLWFGKFGNSRFAATVNEDGTNRFIKATFEELYNDFCIAKIKLIDIAIIKVHEEFVPSPFTREWQTTIFATRPYMYNLLHFLVCPDGSYEFIENPEENLPILIEQKRGYNPSNIFENCNFEHIYFKGNIRELYLMKQLEMVSDVFEKCEDINIIDSNEKHININDIFNNEIAECCNKIFTIEGDVFYKLLEIGVENCYVSILKDSSISNNKSRKNKNGLWKLFITCMPVNNEESIEALFNKIIEGIKNKYAFLLIRSDIYIAISSILLEDSRKESSIYNYDENYAMQKIEGVKFKPSVISVENIDEEFIIIENKNTDAIDCVKAYSNALDIYDLTQEKLDSIYERIDFSVSNNTKDRILIEGPARSGKTIIAFQLLNKYKNAKFLLMNYYFYRAIKDAFNAYNVEFPYNRIYHHDLSFGRETGCAARKGDRSNGWQSKFAIDLDFIIVDEAQRLSNLPGRQGDYRWFPGFDQLDIILKEPQTAILLGDDLQRLNHKKENGGFKEIKRKLSNWDIDYYNYYFSEAIGIPTYLVNSIKYLLSNDENYKDTLNDFNVVLANELSNFVSDFKKEPTNKKHYSFIPGVNLFGDSIELSKHELSFYPYDRSDDYFLNGVYQTRYLFSTYEMISRELEVMYLYIPEVISYSKTRGIYDSSGEVPQDFLLNHLYVNMTRATEKLVIYTKNKSLFEYLSGQISVLSGTQVQKWKDLVVENQKINFVLSYSDKRNLDDLRERLSAYGFEGFIHCATIENIRKILSSNSLKSRSDSDGIFNDIADQGVISITSEFVKNRVRFYLKPNTPTLYRFAERENDLVILCFDYSLAKDYEVYFTDGNAGSKYSKISGCINEVLNYDWDTIFSRGVILEEGKHKDEVVRKRNAELLVNGPVNVSKYLKCIFVKNDNYASALKQEFPKYSDKIIVKEEYFK